MNEPRAFEFEPTPAVSAARAHTRYVRCPACQADNPRYLFHKTGVRFVRCAACGMVYVNPASAEARANSFDIEGFRPFANAGDRALALRDFARLLEHIGADHERIQGKPIERTLLLGRYLRDFAALPEARRVGLDVAAIDEASFTQLAGESDLRWAQPMLARAPQVVILHELLESCGDPGVVLGKLVEALPPTTLLVVTYTNTDSLPARMMRRHWPPFFEHKTCFFSTSNLATLMARFGRVLKTQYALPVTHTAEYVADRVAPRTAASRLVNATPLRDLRVPVRAGNRVAVFGRQATSRESGVERLSIVLPVFNEVRYAAQVIDAVLAKPLAIDKEVVIVESNSTDGTRDIVRKYEGRPGVRVVYEDGPRGKGHAVRTGLKHVTGTIVLIQDADFEYDINDYDALLEPILQHKATFVLGSRSLGLDDWKVRKYDATPIRGLALNFAQVVFARTYDVLYQQRVTDVNTMYKVFRAECLDGLDLHSNGFELDIELACKLARNGNSPMEVPVNYIARGFDEGKKIRFWRDAIPSYAAFFKYRFG
ncbi:MAG TPA: glycosyltransferase [Polyangiaceae bacterium]|jgi:Zn ribbon nucleic-acid-binding protein|nr:glycosyltransferase [Polyangiaceae bacterium]